MKKRIFSRILALVMAVSLLSTTAFAASFADLQSAIDGKEGTGTDIGGGRYGYGKQDTVTGKYGIEAWNGTRTETVYDENGNVTETKDDVATRYVQLNEDVNYSETDTSGIRVGQYLYGENHAYDVTLDLNGHDIDLNPGAVLDADTGKFYKAEKDAEGNKVATEELVNTNTLNNGSVIEISYLYDNSYNLTINDSSANGDGSITGGYNSNNNGGGIYGGRGNITLNGGNITGNYSGVYGGGVYVGGVNGTLVMNGGSISNNYAAKTGGGILVNGTFLMNNGNISGNTSVSSGGGVYNLGKFTMKNGEISGNRTNTSEKGGGGVTVNTQNAKFTMVGGRITGNSAPLGSGVLVKNSNFEVSGGLISENDVVISSDYSRFSQMTQNGGTISGSLIICGNAGIGSEKLTTKDGLVYSFAYTSNGDNTMQTVTITVLDSEGNPIGESATTSLLPSNTKFKVDTTDPANPRIELVEDDINSEVTETFGLGGYVDNTGFHPYEDDGGNDPDDNDSNGTDAGDTTIPDAMDTLADTGTTIEDDEVPLAGLVTLAQLLEELRQYEDIEDVELPEDFQWLDHEYAQAIYWGLQEALVVDTEDDPLDPDEIVTVALLREVLENFVEYMGVDLTVTIEGEEDMIVMDLGERLSVFYGELEAALEGKAA